MNKGQGQDLGEGSPEDERLGIRGEKLPTAPESLLREKAEQAVPGSRGPHSCPNLTARSPGAKRPWLISVPLQSAVQRGCSAKAGRAKGLEFALG